MVGVPVGTDGFAIESATGIVRDGGEEPLARMLPRMPNKPSADLTATGYMVQRTVHVEQVMDRTLSVPACRRVDNGVIWMFENLLELPGTAGKLSFFQERCMAERLTLLPHQRAQASSSTGAGGLECSRRKREICSHR